MIIPLKKCNITARTSGKGIWSKEKSNLLHRKIHLNLWQYSGESYEGELQVFFTKRDWNIDKYGLVYTDPFWIKEFRAGLISHGFSEKEVKYIDYTEQGMQGKNYISLDVGSEFIFAVRNELYLRPARRLFL
jgi:hypothetical protein